VFAFPPSLSFPPPPLLLLREMAEREHVIDSPIPFTGPGWTSSPALKLFGLGTEIRFCSTPTAEDPALLLALVICFLLMFFCFFERLGP